MVNPKYNTYFDKLKTKNLINKNLICIQLFIKLLFISMINLGLQSPQLSLIILLILYIVYVLAIAFTIRLTKVRIHIAYISVCSSVILQIGVLTIYYYLTLNIGSNNNVILAFSWIFVVFLIISLLSSTIYAIIEFICVLPTLFTYIRQFFNYLSSKEDKIKEE